jgi:phosphohistidine phosphatase
VARRGAAVKIAYAGPWTPTCTPARACRPDLIEDRGVDVYLIRHGEAVEETLALPDAARYLSAAGRAHARALGDRLRWYDCVPVQVWTSPLVRAVQTAELVVAGLQLATAVDILALPALAPSGPVEPLVAALRALPAESVVVVVGHEPGLSGLGGVLLGRGELRQLRKAEAARIQDGALRWRFAHDDEAPRNAASG